MSANGRAPALMPAPSGISRVPFTPVFETAH